MGQSRCVHAPGPAGPVAVPDPVPRGHAGGAAAAARGPACVAAGADAWRLHCRGGHHRVRVPGAGGHPWPPAGVLAVARRAAGRVDVRVLRGLPRTLAARPPTAVAQDSGPGHGLRRRGRDGHRRARGAWVVLRVLAGRAVRGLVGAGRRADPDLHRRVLRAGCRVAGAERVRPRRCAPQDAGDPLRPARRRDADHRAPIRGRGDRHAAVRPAAVVLDHLDPAALRDPALARLRRGEASGDGDSGAAATQRALPDRSPWAGDRRGGGGHRRDAGVRAAVRQRAVARGYGPHARRAGGGVALWRPDGAGGSPHVAASHGTARSRVLPRRLRRAAPADHARRADAHGQRPDDAGRDD